MSIQSLTFDADQRFHLVTHEMHDALLGSAVAVRMLASPINQIDLLVLADTYPVKPRNFEAQRPIPGYDGVGVVTGVGPQVSHLAKGDKVVVAVHGCGTWRSEAIFDQDDLLAVPSELEPLQGAILRMGLAPAWMLLADHGQNLLPGDWIIHTAASSVIAHFITQLAKLRGLHVVSVIRDREGDDFDRTERQLCATGVDRVIRESDLASLDIKNIRLAFDAVGSPLAEQVVSALAPEGTFVAYGFLAHGVTSTTGMAITPKMIWADQKVCKGFRFSKSWAQIDPERRQSLIISLAELLIGGQIIMPPIDGIEWGQNGSGVAERLGEFVQRYQKQQMGLRKAVIMFA